MIMWSSIGTCIIGADEEDLLCCGHWQEAKTYLNNLSIRTIARTLIASRLSAASALSHPDSSIFMDRHQSYVLFTCFREGKGFQSFPLQ